MADYNKKQNLQNSDNLRDILISHIDNIKDYFDVNTNNIKIEDYQIIILVQCVVIICLIIFSFICFVCCCCDSNDEKSTKSSNKKRNSEDSNYKPVDVNNLGVSPIKNNNYQENKQGVKNMSSENTMTSSSPIAKIDNDSNDERENSFAMRLREEEQKKINHEKNVAKKLQKKINKASNNASDDDNIDEWKVIKQGKLTEMKKKHKKQN